MHNKVLATLFLMVITALPVHAAHPLVTDDTGTHGFGNYQLEVNGETGFDRQTQGGVVTRTRGGQAAAILSAGIAETVDLVFGAPWHWSREKQDGSPSTSVSGMGDASLEAKWRFFQRPGFSLALKPGITLPTGDEQKGLGSGRVSGGLSLIATQELAPLTLHLNASWFHNEFGREEDRQTSRSDIGRASLALQAAIVKNLQFAGEIALETPGDRTTATWPVFMVGGVIYSVTDRLDLDLGIRYGLSDPAADVALLAGMSVHF